MFTVARGFPVVDRPFPQVDGLCSQIDRKYFRWTGLRG